MKNKRLQITKKVLQIAIPFTLMMTSTGCKAHKEVEKGKDSQDSSVVEIQATEDLSTEVQDSEPVENQQTEELSTDVQIVPDDSLENIQSEDQVITYLETIDQRLEQLFTKENFNKVKDQTKDVVFSSLVTTIEFFSDNESIGGYYFSDLTTPAKQKAMEIIERIDTKIREHYPDYKEYIKEKWNLGYDSFKSLFEKGKIKVKEIIGEETYDNITETKDKIKEKTKEKVSEWKKDATDWYHEKKKEYQ